MCIEKKTLNETFFPLKPLNFNSKKTKRRKNHNFKQALKTYKISF